MTGNFSHHKIAVGDLTVTMVSDGYFPANADIFPTVDEERLQAALDAAGVTSGADDLPPGGYESSVNTFVIDDGSNVHLIDAGGAGMAPSLGKLTENLAAAGYQPGQVKSLIATHLHPDHIGGATVDGKPAFPNAEMVVSAADHGFWTNPDIINGAPDDARPFFDMANGAVAAYSDRLRLIGDNEEVCPGVVSVALPGHTPGHTGFIVSSGNETLMIWADIVHQEDLQFDDPSVTLVFDIDPDQAISTRKRVFDQVATDGLLIAGSHLRLPAVGHVEKSGQKYRFAPQR